MLDILTMVEGVMVLSMKTTEERVSIMFEIENLAGEWHDYIESFGNECAYTDCLIEKIQKLAKEL